MRRAKLPPRLLFALGIWLVAATVIGCTAAVVLGGHGSAVFVVFALAVGVFGALGSSVILSSKRLSSLTLPARASIASLVAFSPMLVLALYGLLTRANTRSETRSSFWLLFSQVPSLSESSPSGWSTKGTPTPMRRQPNPSIERTPKMLRILVTAHVER
jgi:hypothetical protein